MDNFTRSLRRCGEIILEWIPEIYQSARIIQILREDGTREGVPINGHGGSDVDFSQGKYAVVVEAGPSFSTRRQEASESLMELGTVYPQAMALIGDLVVGNMDWEGAQEAASRLKPPQFAQGNVPPQVQSQITQMQQKIQQLTIELNIATDKLHHRQEEIASKERIANLNSQTILIKSAMDHDAKDSQIAFTEALSHQQHRLDLLKVGVPVDDALSQNTQETIQNSTGGASSGQSQGQP